MKIQIFNPDLSSEERTYLDADYSSGVTLTVRNNSSFTANYFVVVGEPGQEQTECKQISSTTSNATITIAGALKFSHPKSTPVYLSKWDKWAVERSNSATGTFAVITNSPFDIEWDNKDLATLVEDVSGSSSHYYRWRPLNSITSTYGSYSDILSGGGQSRSTVGYVINQVKRNPLAKDIDDETIIEFFNDFQELVYEEIPKAWWFLKEGTQVSTVADTYKYSISDNWSDFLSMKYMLYRYTNGDVDVTYPLSFSPQIEFYNLKADSDQATDDYATRWSFLPPDSSSALGYIGIHPTPDSTNCYLAPVYNFALTDLNTFGDTLVVPKPKGYVDYALYRIASDIKLDMSNADKYNSMVRSDIISLKRRSRRQLGQPEFTRFRGQRGFSKNFGDWSYQSNQDSRELYW
jgi:hypothetical protein